MTTTNYYQINDEEQNNNIAFEPIIKKNKQNPFNDYILRNIMILSTAIGMGLLLFSIKLSSYQYKTTNMNTITNTNTTITNTTITNTTITNTTNTNTNTKYSILDNETIIILFNEFKSNYNKTYNSTYEEELRYNNFRNFLYVIDERNSNDSYAIHGITKFADLSTEEFKNIFLGYKYTNNINNNATIVYASNYEGNDTIVNWANIYTTPVKDQGYCGSCWAFSATEQIESDAIRLGLLTTEDLLSPEQIIQCDNVDDGCNGGNTETAFDYIISAGGIESDIQYPYTSYYDVTGNCKTTGDYEVTIDEYYSLADEESMMSHIFSTGPISICLDASNWSSYVSGIITNCGMDVDHCVQAVGLNMDQGYWIIRNSWGNEWGNEGYIWLEAGTNMCNIEYDPKYVNAVKV